MGLLFIYYWEGEDLCKLDTILGLSHIIFTFIGFIHVFLHFLSFLPNPSGY